MTAPERLARTAEPPGPGEQWTVLRMILWSAGYLEEKGVPDARLDAEHLLADALGVDRLRLYLQHDRPLGDGELAAYKERLKRRARREPLQHILGSASFRELELRVDPRALIPRPETEELVQAVLEWCRERERAPESALDLGTGTGAIALSLALEGPFARVTATDASPEALSLASENLEAVSPGECRVDLRPGRFFGPVRGERFDVIVSNPPYVAEDEIESLAPEIREWEPVEALVAGPRGTEALERIVDEAGDHLAPAGLLALEVGLGQAEEVAESLEGAGTYRRIRVRKDLTGRRRFVLAEVPDTES